MNMSYLVDAGRQLKALGRKGDPDESRGLMVRSDAAGEAAHETLWRKSGNLAAFRAGKSPFAVVLPRGQRQ